MRIDSADWEAVTEQLGSVAATLEAAASELWLAGAVQDPTAATRRMYEAVRQLSDVIIASAPKADGVNQPLGAALQALSESIIANLEECAAEASTLTSPARRTPTRLSLISDLMNSCQNRLSALQTWTQTLTVAPARLDVELARLFDSHSRETKQSLASVFDIDSWKALTSQAESLREELKDALANTRQQLDLLPKDAQNYQSGVQATFAGLEKSAADFRSDFSSLAEEVGPATSAAVTSRLRWLVGQVNGVAQTLYDLPEKDDPASASQLLSVIERELQFNVDELLQSISAAIDMATTTANGLHTALIEMKPGEPSRVQ